ncbi:unnamed protein product, partial [Adineta steineri]
PIIGYAEEELLSLSDACQPLINIVDDILKYVKIALDNTSTEPPNKLTKDEAASIHMYTMEWEDGHKSLYTILNYTLRMGDRDGLKPWYKYLKLFLTALVKLPCAPPQTVWRGVRRNITEEFPPGAQITWWSFSSCTTSLNVLESDLYLGNVGERTLFSIELINGRTIKDYSYFDTEDEILMLPGTYMEVQSQFTPAPDLHIIHLKQMVPKDILLETPFQGACLYPKPKRHWYLRKRVVFSVTIALILIIIGSVLGSRTWNHSPALLFSNNTKIISNYSLTDILHTLKFGQNYSSIITGTTNGTIYGTNIYAEGSDYGTAAVHAGILRNGETKNITIIVLPGRTLYTASTQNGISSYSYGSWSRSYSFENVTFESNVTPLNFADYNGNIGDSLYLSVTGAMNGRIYGTNIYTDDSDLATAAIHAGVLHNGETKNITIKILSGRSSYAASVQNDISSLSYGLWKRSYSFENITLPTNITPVDLADYNGKIGDIICYLLRGTVDGYIYGTNIYADFSNLASSAVHAGVLHIGETKNISIKILPGQSLYESSIQNGLSSLSYGHWTRSFSFKNVKIISNIAPVNLANYDGKIGDIISFKLTGAIYGYIYGTNIYTDDSNLATTAVHAGILHVDETKNITIKILPGQSSYDASTHNNVTSYSYGSWTRSYTFM